MAKKAKKTKSAKRGAKKPTQVASAKSCGTYMYRKDGKCVDARAKNKGSWRSAEPAAFGSRRGLRMRGALPQQNQ